MPGWLPPVSCSKGARTRPALHSADTPPPSPSSPHACSPPPSVARTQVTGSRSVDVGTKGQRADHRIVEVALFFQQEVLSSGGGGSSDSSGAGAASITAARCPVLLLSGDNGQVQVARSHGLPAARMTDLAAAQPRLEAALAAGRPLTASLLRSCLGAAAVTGATGGGLCCGRVVGGRDG